MNITLGFVPLSRPHRARRGLLAVAAAMAAAALILVTTTPAHAGFEEIPPNDARSAANTEIVIFNTGSGLNLTGYLPPTVIVQDPEAEYPATPPAGYLPDTTFAGVILTESLEDPTLEAEMYCINLRVSTYVGVGYVSDSWDESNVPNVEFVTYILNNYYPTVAAPAGLNANQQAAAVQAAIWFFTDGFVLGAQPAAVRAATAAIIADTQTNGPATEPPAPDVAITPASATVAEGTVAGPFTVTASGATSITVSALDGYTMYSDAGATTALPNPSEVASGTEIWITGPGVTGEETVLTARAAVTVQRGNVYVYDGNTLSLQDAQKLILADTAVLEAVATATTEFFAVGDLTVNKAFTGGAVGQQGAIQLAIDCGEGFTFTADIPAGATTTDISTFSGIPAGNTCTVTEPTTGGSAQVLVTSDAPQSVVMLDAGAAVTVTNTVEFAPGSLSLVKVLAGGGAGSQDEISVTISCVSGLEETFIVPAGSAAGEYTQTYAGLPAGDECTVAELATGSNTIVEVTTDAPITVTINPGAASEARVTNTVEFRPGALNLTKVIGGAAAGSQSEATVSIICDSGLDETLVIPAGSAAGEYTQLYEDIPAGAECIITELESGANTIVEVVVGDPVTVTIEPAETADAELINTVTFRPGALTVVKVINGPGAGLQSAISLSIECDNGLADTFDIPAGATAGDYVQTFRDLPAGTECTVTETESGANSTVSVIAQTSVTVTIEPGAEAQVRLTNTVLNIPFLGGGVLAVTGVGDALLALLAGGSAVLLVGLLVLALAKIRAARRALTAVE